MGKESVVRQFLENGLSDALLFRPTSESTLYHLSNAVYNPAMLWVSNGFFPDEIPLPNSLPSMTAEWRLRKKSEITKALALDWNWSGLRLKPQGPCSIHPIYRLGCSVADRHWLCHRDAPPKRPPHFKKRKVLDSPFSPLVAFSFIPFFLLRASL